LEGKLQPDLERARELKHIREEYVHALKERTKDTLTSNDNQIASSLSSSTTANTSLARRIWPNLHTILASETGTFQIYGEKLREQYIGRDVTIYSPLYAATEGLIGVNPNIHGKTFVLHPQAMFYEFYPIEASNGSDDGDAIDSEKTLFIEQLEPGKEYEVIITNLTGLYRYRFGDVIRCTGYHHKSPVVEVAYRKGQFMNVTGERTSEETFYKALSRTAKEEWNLTLKDYTTVEYFLKEGNRKPRYVVFVELADGIDGSQPVERVLTSEEMKELDVHLGKQNKSYQALRTNGRLQQIEVITVRNGTFEEVRQGMIANGVGATQIKQPRVTRNEKLIEILERGKV